MENEYREAESDIMWSGTTDAKSVKYCRYLLGTQGISAEGSYVDPS